MSDGEVVQLIRGALVKVRPDLAREFEAIDIETRFEDLPLDSIDNLQMITFLEDHLGFLFQEEDFGTIETVRDVKALIEKRAP